MIMVVIMMIMITIIIMMICNCVQISYILSFFSFLVSFY